MNTEYVKLTESARKLGAHPDTVRYWIKLLGSEPIKRGHVCYIMAETLNVLMVMARLICEGMTAGDAAKKAMTEPKETPIAHFEADPRNDAHLAERIIALENAFLLMAGKLNSSIEETRALRQENAKLRAAVDPDAKVRAWLASFAEPIPQNPETARDRYERLCADQISHVLLLEH